MYFTVNLSLGILILSLSSLIIIMKITLIILNEKLHDDKTYFTVNHSLLIFFLLIDLNITIVNLFNIIIMVIMIMIRKDVKTYFTANPGERGLAILTAWCELILVLSLSSSSSPSSSSSSSSSSPSRMIKDLFKFCWWSSAVAGLVQFSSLFDLWLFLPLTRSHNFQTFG